MSEIDLSTVAVGDTMVQRDKERIIVSRIKTDPNSTYPFEIDGIDYLQDGSWNDEDVESARDIIEIIKKAAPLEEFPQIPEEAESPDMVNRPPHYTNHPSGVECKQITREMTFNIGCVIKYCWRHGLKGPGSSEKEKLAEAIKDLEKAQFYLNDEIERLRG